MAAHHHLLLAQLLCDVLCARAAHVDPRLGEEGARAEHKDNVREAMKRIVHNVAEALRRRQIVADAACRIAAIGALRVGPRAEQIDEEVAAEFGCEHLRDDVQIGDES